MPQFIEGTPIGPEIIAAAGQIVTTPGGAKEIHINSAAQYSQYASMVGAGTDVTDPNFTPQLIEGPAAISAAAPSQPELLPPEVMKALMSGNPPPQNLMPQAVPTPAARPVFPSSQHAPDVQLKANAIELRVPVGGGIVASVTFSGEPKAKHWKRLLAHIQIEADPDNEFQEETITTKGRAQPIEKQESARTRADRKRGRDDFRAGDDES